jgi:HK97 family phage prohead protease
MTIIHKTVAERDGMDFVLSDETVDRYGDIIVAKGWDLKDFKKNPIALFGHQGSFPIGNWTNVRVEGTKLIGTLVLAAAGTSERINELISLVQQGILRAVSVGFRPIENEPIDPKQPYGGQRYTKSQLLETSLVSVPANPAALAIAKSLHISDETLEMAFGEHATKRRDLTATGENADTTSADLTRSRADRQTQAKAPKMKTLSQRIEDAQADLTAKRDKLAELTGADDLDNDAVVELTAQIDTVEKTVATLKGAEAKIGASARTEQALTVPAQVRKPLGHTEKDGMDLWSRLSSLVACPTSWPAAGEGPRAALSGPRSPGSC